MDKTSILIASAATAAAVAIGTIVYNNSSEPTGPGSGEVVISEPTGPGSGDVVSPDESEPTGPGSGDILNEETLAKYALGSCDAIDESSTCLEYIGDYWKDHSAISLNCQGVGVYSDNPCPRPTSGGCLMESGTQLERVMWLYSYGGNPIQGIGITAMAGACQGNGGQFIFSN